MEKYSALLVLCVGNSPVTGEFPSQRPETRSFDAFVDQRLNKRLSNKIERLVTCDTIVRIMTSHDSVIYGLYYNFGYPQIKKWKTTNANLHYHYIMTFPYFVTIYLCLSRIAGWYWDMYWDNHTIPLRHYHLKKIRRLKCIYNFTESRQYKAIQNRVQFFVVSMV